MEDTQIREAFYIVWIHPLINIYIYIYIPEAINEVETESYVYADDTYQDKDVEKTEEVINK